MHDVEGDGEGEDEGEGERRFKTNNNIFYYKVQVSFAYISSKSFLP